MARIRSQHPGQASDEDFVALSMEARVFCMLLRCFADDQGVFEWKPKTLKMQIFPADNVDAVAILDELQDNKQVLKFEHDGKSYGAIRNFRIWQRPKKPTAIYPLPNELRNYVGLDGESSPPVPPQEPTKPEIPPQMEDVGGRREEVVDTAPPRDPGCEYIKIFDDTVSKTWGRNQERLCPHSTDLGTARKWIDLGVTPELCASVCLSRMTSMKTKGRSPPQTLSYFDRSMADALAASKQPLPQGNPDDDPLHIPDNLRRKRPDSFAAAVAAASSIVVGE